MAFCGPEIVSLPFCLFVFQSPECILGDGDAVQQALRYLKLERKSFSLTQETGKEDFCGQKSVKRILLSLSFLLHFVMANPFVESIQ